MEPDFKGICASKAADTSECALDMGTWFCLWLLYWGKKNEKNPTHESQNVFWAYVTPVNDMHNICTVKRERANLKEMFHTL